MDKFVGYLKSKLKKDLEPQTELNEIKEAMSKTREFILSKAAHTLGPSHFTHIQISDDNIYYSTSSGNICCYSMSTIKVTDDTFFSFPIEKFIIDNDLLGMVTESEFKLFTYPECHLLHSLETKVSKMQAGIYTASTDGSIMKWDAQGSALVYKENTELKSFYLMDNLLYVQTREVKIISLDDDNKVLSTLDKDFISIEVSSKYLAGLEHEDILIYNIPSFELYEKIECSSPLCASLSLNSHYLAVGCRDSIIRVYDLESSRSEIVMRGHQEKLIQILISPCMNYIASISEDQRLKLWTFPEFPEEIIIKSASKICLIYIHGSDLIVCNSDNKVFLYNEELVELFQIKSAAMSVATANNFLLVGDELGYIYIYDKITSAFILNKKAHNGAVRGLIVRENNVFTGGADSVIYIWKVFNEGGIDPKTIEKVTLTGHKQAVWKLELSGDFLISGSSDNTVRIWNIQDNQEIGVIDCNISTLAVGEVLVTGSFEGEVCLWNLYDLNIESKIDAHARAVNGLNIVRKFLFSSSVDGVICVISLDHRNIIAKINCKEPIYTMQVNESHIFIGCKNKMVIKKNFFFDDKIVVVGPQDLLQNFLLYVKELYLKRHPKHNQTMDQFVILPYFINTLHLYTFLNMSDYLKNSLENFSPLLAHPYSPFCYSIFLDLRSIRGTLLSTIIQLGEMNPYIFKLVEPHLVTLNIVGLNELYDLYEAAYMQVSRSYLPATCSIYASLPQRKAALNQRIQKEDFFNEEDLTEGVTVMYKENYLGINMNIGSNKSIEFIYSLINCPNPQILRASFVQDMVKYKWDVAKFPMYIQAWMYFFYMAVLGIYLEWFKRDPYCLGTLFGVNLLLTIYETFQMIVFKNYFSSIWNYLDWIRSILLYIYIITETTLLLSDDEEVHESYDDYILELLFIGSCVRGISYFRIFTKTRYLIRLLQESIANILGYLVFFSYFIVAFSIINLVNDIRQGSETNSSEFVQASRVFYIYDTYELALGSFFKNQDYDLAQWTVLALVSLILCIIITNIMISIIGDSFEKVQTDSLSADTQELLEMIYEVENMFVARRLQNNVYYFQLVDNYNKDEEETWEGRIRKVSSDLEKASLKQRKQFKEQNEEFDKKTKAIQYLGMKVDMLRRNLGRRN